MIALNEVRAVAAALTTLVFAAVSSIASADIKDYAFQLVNKAVRVGPDTIITLKLVNTKTGKSVPDAVIVATRLDMAPDGMAEMVTKIAPLLETEPGLYRFKAQISMAGGWRLSLAAKVQGEEGTVDDKLVFQADE